jgi:predicted ATPase
MPLPNNDVDFYLVIEDFGDRGPSFLETDVAQADRDFFALQSVCRGALSRWMALSAGLQLSESLQNFRVAVVAMDDGRFAYQVFLVCGEPRTLLTDSARYLTPEDAAQAGYEAVASMFETPVRRPYAPISLRRKTAPW